MKTQPWQLQQPSPHELNENLRLHFDMGAPKETGVNNKVGVQGGKVDPACGPCFSQRSGLETGSWTALL